MSLFAMIHQKLHQLLPVTRVGLRIRKYLHMAATVNQPQLFGFLCRFIQPLTVLIGNDGILKAMDQQDRNR